MDLKKISLEINKILEQKRKELQLTFIEDKHIYYMKDVDGKVKKNFPSVSKIIKKFHQPFDSVAKSLQMCDGDEEEARKLQEQWTAAGEYSTNMGSRVHYLLETDLISRYGNYKEVRQPIFNVDKEQIRKSNNMILAGKKYLDLMHERGAVLLDTEVVLGHPLEGYTGQPDKSWLMLNKQKDGFGFIVTDWKGLPLDTPILTNSGWKTMGELNKHDMVFDKDGNLTKIKNFSKIKNVKCLKIKFDNGEEIISDFEHRWLVYTEYNGKKNERVLTTQEIKNYYENKRLKPYQILRIENSKPLKLEHVQLPIDPYVLGVWLGDGHSADGKITQMNENVWKEIIKRGYIIGDNVSGNNSTRATTRTIMNIRGKLSNLNLLKNKHLPIKYLLSSYEQRLDVLRGLMDSDGYYNKKRNRFSISTTRLNQVEFSIELISSLGLKPTIVKYNKKINGKIIKCYNVEFSTNNFNPFLVRNQDINVIYKKNRRSHRRIISIDDVESVPTRCIEVESKTNTFLVGKSLIVTHNTNQPKNFVPQKYNGYLYPPFDKFRDYALTHYFMQLPLYARLLIRMLEGSEYENLKLLGCVVVLLKEDGTFEEYRVPQEMINIVLTMDLKKYLK